MAANLFDLWKDTANLRYRSTVQTRKQPFSNYQWTSTPKLQGGAILNPLKVGIVGMWMMRGMLEAPTWPGHAHAQIWDSTGDTLYALEVGSLDVANLRTESSSFANSLNNSLSAIPGNLEKRWLQCFSNTYWYFMCAFFRDKVGDDPRYRIQPVGNTIVHYPCGGGAPHDMRPINPRDELRIVFMPAAAADSPQALTWGLLAQAMVDWVNKVAQGTWEYRRPFPVMVNYQMVAVLGVIISPARGTDSTATA
ncbi:MAG: hypothetical protein Q9170_005647 [Blastenia crenularia]